MSEIIFRLEGYEKKMYEVMVGPRQVGPSLRQYIRSCIYTKNKEGKELQEEKVIEKKLELLKPEKDKIVAEYNKLHTLKASLEQKRKQEELKRLEEEQKEKDKLLKIKGDTMKANLHRVV